MNCTGTIDESSETVEKGKRFDSSTVAGENFHEPIGAGKDILLDFVRMTSQHLLFLLMWFMVLIIMAQLVTLQC